MKYDQLGGYPGHTCTLKVEPYLTRSKLYTYTCECGWRSMVSRIRNDAIDQAQRHQRLTLHKESSKPWLLS